MQFQLSIFYNSFNDTSLLRYEFILEFPQFHNSTNSLQFRKPVTSRSPRFALSRLYLAPICPNTI